MTLHFLQIEGSLLPGWLRGRSKNKNIQISHNVNNVYAVDNVTIGHILCLAYSLLEISPSIIRSFSHEIECDLSGNAAIPMQDFEPQTASAYQIKIVPQYSLRYDIE